MKRSIFFIHYTVVILLLAVAPFAARSQQGIIINMATIDGVPLTPANVLNYQVQATGPVNVEIKGSIRYRNSSLSMSYSFNYALKQGINGINKDIVNPHWQFSSSALRELFFTYNILPAGTFEYCVDITPVNTLKESSGNTAEECLYHRADDVFLINLIDPSDKSKLKEYNPLLAWVANYSFSNELTYRVRVAEIKQGQNAANAVLRNQPVYDEQNLTQSSLVYPIYAKPLVANQPYAWTVDAYYKGILLGGAEIWQFIIVDSLPVTASETRSYIDIRKESGLGLLTALGNLKLKYVLDDAQTDMLKLEITDDKNDSYSLKPDKLNAVYGDNRYTIELLNSASLKHKEIYTLKITTNTAHEYKLLFQFINPDYQH